MAAVPVVVLPASAPPPQPVEPPRTTYCTPTPRWRPWQSVKDIVMRTMPVITILGSHKTICTASSVSCTGTVVLWILPALAAALVPGQLILLVHQGDTENLVLGRDLLQLRQGITEITRTANTAE